MDLRRACGLNFRPPACRCLAFRLCAISGRQSRQVDSRSSRCDSPPMAGCDPLARLRVSFPATLETSGSSGRVERPDSSSSTRWVSFRRTFSRAFTRAKRSRRVSARSAVMDVGIDEPPQTSLASRVLSSSSGLSRGCPTFSWAVAVSFRSDFGARIRQLRSQRRRPIRTTPAGVKAQPRQPCLQLIKFARRLAVRHGHSAGFPRSPLARLPRSDAGKRQPRSPRPAPLRKAQPAPARRVRGSRRRVMSS